VAIGERARQPERKRRLEHARHPGGALEVAHAGLDGADHHGPLAVWGALDERSMQRSCFDWVAERGARTCGENALW
jgi:hypothetical protein